MAYNMSYTTLPVFSSNSIGYNVTQDLNTNNFVPSTPQTFSAIVPPGVYAFGSTFSANLPVSGGSLIAALVLNSSTTTLCQGTQSNSSGGDTCVTLSHIFTVSTNDSVILNLTQVSSTLSLNCTYSYGLVRIA